MAYGPTLQEARKEKGLTQEQLAMDLHITRSYESHIERGRRRPAEDIAKRALDKLDCPFLLLETKLEYTNGMSSPVLRGRTIEQHRLAIRDLAIREAEEALDHIKQVCLIKPPQATDEQEKAEIERVLEEILDAVAGLANLKAKLAKEYNISIKRLYEKRKPVWKTRGWI